MRERVIKNNHLLFLLILSLLDIISEGDIRLADKIVGILIVSIPMLVITLFSNGGFGGGDIKLIAVCGFLLGKERILRASWITLLLTAVYVLGYLSLTYIKAGSDRSFGRLKPEIRAEFPLGPFICISVMAIFLEVL